MFVCAFVNDAAVRMTMTSWHLFGRAESSPNVSLSSRTPNLFLLADSILYNNTLGLALVPFAETCWAYDFQLEKVLCVIARCSLLNFTPEPAFFLL